MPGGGGLPPRNKNTSRPSLFKTASHSNLQSYNKEQASSAFVAAGHQSAKTAQQGKDGSQLRTMDILTAFKRHPDLVLSQLCNGLRTSDYLCVLLQITPDQLADYFEAHPDVAFIIYKSDHN